MTAPAARIAFLSFTDRGAVLAERLRLALGGTATCAHGGKEFSLARWTGEAFAQNDALVFVGAVGIAVRAVAPHLVSKATDPAVVAVDEWGRFAVPVASGHLGGANDLARRIAALCGGTAVITTATDLGGLFAVDEWARRNNCAVVDPEGIKRVSAKVLAGETVRIHSPFPLPDGPPRGVALADGPEYDVLVDVRRGDGGAGLWLAPRIAALGVGCRKGTGRAALEEAFARLLAGTGLTERAVCRVATIDLKGEEPGLLEFCRARGWPLEAYSPQALARAAGTFTASPFVERTTGVDNVCERAAVLASGGALYEKKNAGGGVTMAVALAPWRPDWRWQNG